MDYCLSIGLDNYIKLKPPTPFAENDAQGFHDVMGETYGADYNDLIVGSNATYKNIEHSILDVKSKIESKDRFFLFFAGHGENIGGVPHISCYDSQPGREDSWHNLIELMKQINSSGCNKLLFFIDACESTIGLGSRKRRIDKFSPEELEGHIKSNKYSCVFSATSHKGIADVIPEEKHGIWSFFLLNALRGKETLALTEKNWLTNYSLQNYLNIVVKKYCSGKPDVTLQNAFKWGKEEGEFLIKAFKKMEIEEYRDIPKSCIKRIEFRTRSQESVKNLSGFKKGFHKVPQYKSSSTDNFINKISINEISDRIESVSASLRELLKLKRRDFNVHIEGGRGLFECPYFTYEYSIELSEEDPSAVTFEARLAPIDINKLITVSKDIDSCFPEWFDTLVYTLSKTMNLEELIDRIEEKQDEVLKGFEIDYDSEITYVSLYSKKLRRTVTISHRGIEFSFQAKEKIPDMLDGLKQLSNQLLIVSSDYKLLE